MNNINKNEDTRRAYAQHCQSCGACCSYYAYYNFQIPIWNNSPQQPPKKYVQIGRRMPARVYDFEAATTRFMRRKVNQAGQSVCMALKGFIGKRVACEIYDQRPSSCTEFDPGSDWCLNARKWAGLE